MSTPTFDQVLTVAQMGAADPIGVMDAGYIADKARWMAGNGDEAGARRLLAERLPLAQTPADPEDWYEIMFARAKASAADGDWTLTYAIASRVDDAFSPGTDISAQSVGIRDDYTNLTWLAGTTAFGKLNPDSQSLTDVARGWLHSYLGLCLMRLGRPQEAITQLRAGRQLLPQESQVGDWLAQVEQDPRSQVDQQVNVTQGRKGDRPMWEGVDDEQETRRRARPQSPGPVRAEPPSAPSAEPGATPQK